MPHVTPPKQMNSYFRPSGRKSLTDQTIDQDLDGEDLKNFQFLRLVAIKRRFRNCDFSYSQFDAAYLRNCIFDSCKFIGCKFTHSNLRGSVFEGCVFDYVEFSHTHVEPEILETGCPGHENLQQKFARTLRVNFQQIGDAISTNKAIMLELEATRVHLYKAWRSRESYYRKKYSGIKRVGAFFDWLKFVLLDAYWGNGESALKLLRSMLLLTLAIALGDVVCTRDPRLLTSYWHALAVAPQVLLGIHQPAGFSGSILALIAAIRYVMLACLVSIFVKRYNRR